MTHEYALITVKGGAESLRTELSELGIEATVKGMEWCSAALTEKQLLLLKARCQAASWVIELLTIGDREAVEAAAGGVAKPSGTFCVRAHAEDSQDLQETIGAIIFKATQAPVNLSKPDTTYLIFETDDGLLFGIDQLGALSKRHYKIITGAQSLTGPFAYATLRAAGWTPKTDLVVWPCTTGELAVEAALATTEKSPRAYELQMREDRAPRCDITCADPKLSMVRSAEKNAKVAGVHKAIKFSRQDADWLETKYEERSVGLLVGLLPNLKLLPKLAPEVIYQLDFILKKHGRAAFLCVNDESAERLEAAAGGSKDETYLIRRSYLWGGKHAFILVHLELESAKKPRKKKELPPPAE